MRAVRRAVVDDLLPLRHRVLRPGRPLATAHFDGDDDFETRHWVLESASDGVIGCASVLRRDGPAPFQLRGMAIAPEHQRTGAGTALLEALFAEVAAPVWCNARATALAFYEARGFVTVGASFHIEPIGMHHRMVRRS